MPPTTFSSRLLKSLSNKLAASAGAACHSADCHGADGPPTISSVLSAMGVPTEFAVGTLRLSVGRHSTQADVDEAVKLIVGEVERQAGEGMQ